MTWLAGDETEDGSDTLPLAFDPSRAPRAPSPADFNHLAIEELWHCSDHGPASSESPLYRIRPSRMDTNALPTRVQPATVT
jgi:hypothetical protein